MSLKCRYKGAWCSSNASPQGKAGQHWFLKNRSMASKPELCHGIQPQGHPITRSESNLNLALPGVSGILTHAQPCPDSAGFPGRTLPSPVCELLLSVTLHLSDKSAEDPGQRRKFFHTALEGEVPAPPATMSVTSRGTDFEFPFYVFVFKESWDSDSIKTEAVRAFLLSTLLWPVRLISVFLVYEKMV